MLKSIEEVLKKYPYLKDRKIGFPYVGKRKDNEPFSKGVKEISDAFSLYDSLISTLNNDYSKELNFTSGNPMKYKPFNPAIKEIKKMLNGTDLNRYPYSEGDDKIRKELLKYIEMEGFINNTPYDYNDIDEYGLSIHNLTFTVSTSHAFGLILDIIANDNDVILMTGPNYGLFGFKPERINARVEIIPLEYEDNYLVNPKKLEFKIKEINEKLKNEYKNCDYIPKVAAFVSANPNNPTGKVMGIKEVEILEGIGNVCLRNGVFVIDDLVYRDLTYDKNNIAKPMASIPNMFSNTISLLGLSKSYGLAGLRAGFVVADEVIIREIINRIFQEIDAVPSIIGVALKGAFNNTKKRNKEYNRYFNKLNNEYLFRYNLVKALIMGIDSIEDKTLKKKVLKYLKKEIKNDLNIIYNGIDKVKIKKNLEPESGFFVILDFTDLRGMKYQNNIIETEEDLLRFFYQEIKLRYIIGLSMAWPNDELIGRFTYAKERKEIISVFIKINEAIKKLR